ncbi:hypothetical protein T484DRAFT_1953135 [Baffinella frigidus]|nr:hypothetical protein T484DRAFT_1953135 [Cryptophyta sp. CCMP2293]
MSLMCRVTSYATTVGHTYRCRSLGPVGGPTKTPRHLRDTLSQLDRARARGRVWTLRTFGRGGVNLVECQLVRAGRSLAWRRHGFSGFRWCIPTLGGHQEPYGGNSAR